MNRAELRMTKELVLDLLEPTGNSLSGLMSAAGLDQLGFSLKSLWQEPCNGCIVLLLESERIPDGAKYINIPRIFRKIDSTEMTLEYIGENLEIINEEKVRLS